MKRSLKLLSADAPADSIPFPGVNRNKAESAGEGSDAISAFESVSRRLDDLARRLNCLGFFDEADPDRPRAA